VKKEKVKNEKPRKKIAFVICIVFIFMLAISGIANAGVTETYSEESEVVKVLWDESHGAHSSYKQNERFSTIRENLEINGFQLDEFTTGPITAEILSNYDILVVGTLTSNWNSSHSSAEITAITDYVTYGGGSLLMFGENTDCPNRNINSLANRFGVTFGQSDTNGSVSITHFGTHEIFDGINSIILHTGATMDVRAPSTAVAWYNNESIVATYEGAVFIGDCNWLCNEYIHDEDNQQFGENVFNWLAKGVPPYITVDLVTGYNLLSLPVNDSSVTNASTLATKIGVNCTEIVKWDSIKQRYVSYIPGWIVNDFDIRAGEGYFVNVNNPTTVVFTGVPWRLNRA
jgi:hypothetical protein